MLLALISYHMRAVMYIELGVQIHVYVGVMESTQAYNNRFVYMEQRSVTLAVAAACMESTNYVIYLTDTQRRFMYI